MNWYRPGETIYLPFDTFKGSDGSSLTMTGLAVGDIKIYKDGGTTERGSTTGFTLLDTDGIDFDAITGIHGLSIDLSSDATADFFKAGSTYWVVISSITVDSVTVNFVGERFRIGLPSAILNTYIASLSSQTSFTLNAGPAEDDALNGLELIVWDKASAVQWARAVVQDYTGSSKTVTLAGAPTFTIAAGDNAMVTGQAALQPATAGRTLGLESDGHAHADVKEWLGSAPNALQSGRVDAYLGAVASGVIAAASFAAGAFDAVWTVTTRVLTAATNITSTGGTTVPQTGDSYARLGAPAGASVSADIAAVKGETASILARIGGFAGSGVNTILGFFQAIMRSDATTPSDVGGTYDDATDSLQAIGDRGDVEWVTATGFSTHSAADVWAVGTRTLTSLGTGSGLTAIPWNASWDTEVQSEVQDAIEANHLDHLLAVTYDPAAKPGVSDALLNELVENDGGVSRYTANSLEQAPSGAGTALVEFRGVVTKSGSTYYVSFIVISAGVVIGGASLSALSVTFYDRDGTNLTFSGTPSADASSGIVYAAGTLTTAITDNEPVIVKVGATYNSTAYTSALPAVSIA